MDGEECASDTYWLANYYLQDARWYLAENCLIFLPNKHRAFCVGNTTANIITLGIVLTASTLEIN